ncbi:MalY/PatB family protein [Rhizobium leguminosarum]
MSKLLIGADATPAPYDFDTVLDRGNLSTLKWEMEIARAKDPGLLSFGTADMDFRSPPAVLKAVQSVAKEGHFGYPLKRPGYYEAIVGYLDRHFGWKVEKEWLESGVGIYQSMHPVITELTEPGDEIIYQPPVHHVFAEIIEANDRVAVSNQLLNRRGAYEMDFAGLEAAITCRTKLLLLCSPHNPVGRVWTLDELRRLAAICERRNIIVVTDEVYSGLLYPGSTFVAFASLSQWTSMNTYTMISPSKPFNLTGLKHSIVIAANPAFRAAYRKGIARTNLHYGTSIFGLAGAEAGYRDSDDWTDALMQYVAQNFEYVLEQFGKHLPEVTLTVPEATYFSWLDLAPLGAAKERYQALIEREARLVVTYGEPMGPGGEEHIRLNLATPLSNLAAGVDRLISVLVPLTNRTYSKG